MRRRESPLLPYHTGSSLPSRRHVKGRSACVRLAYYAVVIIIVVAGLFALFETSSHGPRNRHSVQERSGRALSEKTKEEKPPAKQQIPSRVTGLRSRRGQEHEVVSAQTSQDSSERNTTADQIGAALHEGAVKVGIAAVINGTANIAERAQQAAEGLQQSAGNIDPAARLALETQSPTPVSQHGAQAGQQGLQPELNGGSAEGMHAGLHQAQADQMPHEAQRQAQASVILPETQQEQHQQAPILDVQPHQGLSTFMAKDIHGREVSLSQFKGTVTLVVNVASQCGYTESNYRGLNALYSKYKPWGFQVLAFPCNNWNQETGSDAQIEAFAKQTYGIEFPLFAKVNAVGPEAHPIFKFLTENLPQYKLTGWQPKWNFSKWLVDSNGMPVKSYDSQFDMNALEADIHSMLTALQPQHAVAA